MEDECLIHLQNEGGIHWKWAKVAEPPPCFRNPKVWSKAITVRSKNTTIGWIFQGVARPTCFRGHCSEEKVAIFTTKVQCPASHARCVPTGSRNFPDRPRITGSLLQRKHDGTDVWMLVCFPCGMGPFYSHEGNYN